MGWLGFFSWGIRGKFLVTRDVFCQEVEYAVEYLRWGSSSGFLPLPGLSRFRPHLPHMEKLDLI